MNKNTKKLVFCTIRTSEGFKCLSFGSRRKRINQKPENAELDGFLDGVKRAHAEWRRKIGIRVR